MAAQICEYTNNYWIVPFKWGGQNFMVFELYLN